MLLKITDCRNLKNSQESVYDGVHFSREQSYVVRAATVLSAGFTTDTF